jgi:hypothetical protein
MIDTIVLIGRPAAGKSEIFDFLSHASDKQLESMDLGPIRHIDDFPYLWEKFEEDRILAEHGRDRLWTDERGYFTDDFFWVFMIEKINLTYRKELAKDPDGFASRTKIIEFARGGAEGYATALGALCDEVLERARILYVKVPYEVSAARNRRRARPGMEDSILHHSLPDEKMEFYYKVDDWANVTGDVDQGAVEIRGRKIPFVNFINEPELTDDPAKLEPALTEALKKTV